MVITSFNAISISPDILPSHWSQIFMYFIMTIIKYHTMIRFCIFTSLPSNSQIHDHHVTEKNSQKRKTVKYCIRYLIQIPYDCKKFYTTKQHTGKQIDSYYKHKIYTKGFGRKAYEFKRHRLIIPSRDLCSTPFIF